MKRLRGWIARIAVAAAVLAVPAFAAAAGCGSPPDSSGVWYFIDDVALNMRIVAQGPVAYGTYTTVDRQSNYTSATHHDAVLSWSGYSSVKYSASLEAWAGSTDQRKRESIRVTVDIPPMKEALLRIRDASQFDYYTFDAGCIWFNSQTRTYRTEIVAYAVKGHVQREWHESSLSIRTVY